MMLRLNSNLCTYAEWVLRLLDRGVQGNIGSFCMTFLVLITFHGKASTMKVNHFRENDSVGGTSGQ